MRVVFLSYTGLLEPLGRSQVLPYVLGLAQRGHQMSVLSFERSASEGELASTIRVLENAAVAWTRLRYHKYPPVASTVYDIGVAVRHLLELSRARGVDLVHARSHVPCLAAEIARRTAGLPYLFDHRGLMAEEYVDSGLWKRGGLLYRLTNQMERRFLAMARGVVVLTHRLHDELETTACTQVVPCAVDLGRFHPAEKGEAPEFDLVYAGSWSGLYEGEAVLSFHRAYRARHPGSKLLLLVPRSSCPQDAWPGVYVRHPSPEEVPELLRQARAGLSFRRAGRAAIAAAPVKVSEYLASGLPVVTNSGVGDLDPLLAEHRAGVSVPDLTPSAVAAAAEHLERLLSDPATARRCRGLAAEQYSLEGAVARYDDLYRRIARLVPPAHFTRRP